MDTSLIYNSLEWALARSRALSRDGNRCTVARLLGGECSPCLDVHHIQALRDGGAPYDLVNLATVCDSHHPVWEAFRRNLLRVRQGPAEREARCNHFHRTAEARRLCEERIRRQRQANRVAA